MKDKTPLGLDILPQKPIAMGEEVKLYIARSGDSFKGKIDNFNIKELKFHIINDRMSK